MFSDRELGRTVLQYPSLFPFPFLQRSHHEQRPAQGEGRPLAVWLSAQRCRFGSDSRWSLTRKQMTGFEAVGVFENASRPPFEEHDSIYYTCANGSLGSVKNGVLGELSATRNLARNGIWEIDPALSARGGLFRPFGQ